jgi:hypothetical protein
MPTFRQRKLSFFQEFAHLGLGAFDPRQRFNLTLRFFDRRWRVLAKMGFQAALVLDQLAFRLIEVDFLQLFDPAGFVQPKIVPHRVF